MDAERWNHWRPATAGVDSLSKAESHACRNGVVRVVLVSEQLAIVHVRREAVRKDEDDAGADVEVVAIGRVEDVAEGRAVASCANLTA